MFSTRRGGPASQLKNVFLSAFLVLPFAFWLSGCNESGASSHRQEPAASAIRFSNYLRFAHPYARSIFLTDSNLIVTNNKALTGDYFFYVYSLANQQLTGKYVQGGSGKGMALSPLSCGVYQDKILWLQDISTNKVITAPLSSGAAPVLEYPTPQFSYALQLLNNQRALKSGVYHIPQTMEITDLVSGVDQKVFGSLPPAPQGIPEGSWKRAHEGFLFLKPDETKAVLACRYADRLEFFDLASGQGAVVEGAVNATPQFIPIKSGTDYLIQRTEKTVYAYSNGAATDKYAYLLYAGNKQDSEHRIEGKAIYVYDWNGRLIKKLDLDRYVSGFTVTKDDSGIYAFDTESGYVVHASLKH